MPRRLTAINEETGKTVTFDWDPDTDPTESDMAEIFAEAGTETAVPQHPMARLGEGVIRGLKSTAEGLSSLPGALRADPMGTARGLAGSVLRAPLDALETGGQLVGAAFGNRDSAAALVDDPLKAVANLAGAGALGKGVLRGVRGVGKGALEHGAERLYQSATPIARSVIPKAKDQKAAIRAGLEKGITPTRRGEVKLDRLLEGLSGELDQVLDDAGKAGRRASPEPVIRELESAAQKAERVPEVDPQAPGIIRARAREIVTGPTFSNDLPNWGRMPRALPIEDMQTFKSGVQNRAYEGELTGPSLEAEMAAAKGAKQSLEDVDPRVAEVNQQMSPLIDLQRQMEFNAPREGNRPMLSTARSIGGAALAGGAPVQRILGAVLGNLLESQKARAGIGLHRMAQGPTSLTDPALMTALAALMKQRSSGEPEP